MNIDGPIVGIPLSILDGLVSSWELDPDTGRIRVIGPKIGDYTSKADRNGKELAGLCERKIPTGERISNKRKLNIDGGDTIFEDSSNKKKRSENSSDSDEEDNEEEDEEEVESGNESNAEENKTPTKDFSEEGESTDIDYSKYFPKREKRNTDLTQRNKFNKNKAMDIEKSRKRRRNVENKRLSASSRSNILTSDVYRQWRKDDLNSNISKRRKSSSQKLLTLELPSQSEDELSDNRRTKRRQYRNIRRLQRKKYKRNKRSTEFTSESEHERKYNELKRKFKKYIKRTRVPTSSDEEEDIAKSGITPTIKKVKSSKPSNNTRKRQSIRADQSEQSDRASDQIENKEDSRESSADYVPGEPVSFKKGFWRRN